MAYDRTNTGTIAKNTRKTDEKHPDITGTINVNGADWWINGWLRTNTNDGSKFYSLSVKPKEAKTSPDKPPRRPAPAFELREEPTDDDSVPF